MNRMDGKICVVTGATQGLGAAIARRLAAAGANSGAMVVSGRPGVIAAAVTGATSGAGAVSGRRSSGA